MKYILILILFLAGCMQQESKDSLTFPMTIQGQKTMVTYTASMKQNFFLYFTKARNYDHRTMLSSTYVGEVELYPDPKAFEALGNGAIQWLKNF